MKIKSTSFIACLTLFTFLLFTSSSSMAQYQNALDFDGNSDFVNVPNASGLIAGGTTKMSLSCWVNLKTAPLGFPDFDGYAGFRNNTTADFYLIALSATTLEARYRNSLGTFYTITYTGLQLNTWQHFVLTYDNAKLRLYKNSVLVDSLTASGNITATTVPLTIGNVIFNATNFLLNGKVDEVGLWNKALTQSEINCVYKSPIDVASPNLQLYYDFNQGIAGYNNASVSNLLPKFGSINGALQTFNLSGNTSNFVDGVVNYTPLVVNKCAGQSHVFNSQTLTSTGSYSQYLTGASGCDSVVVLTLRIPDTSIVLNGSSLAVDFVPGASYQWKNCTTHAAIVGATGNTYTPTANGSYYVVINLPGTITSCLDSSTCFNLLNVGVNENIQSNSFTLYPNPVNSQLNLEFNIIQKELEVVISDIAGKQVWKSNYTNVSSVKADISHLKAGIYFVETSFDKMFKVSKLLKE